jgi:hypothetical protein
MNKKIEKVEAWGSVILKVREGSFNSVRVRTGESLLESGESEQDPKLGCGRFESGVGLLVRCTCRFETRDGRINR